MLTPSQRRALTSDHHLSITANAGSGKTLVLVERYIKLLLDGKAPVGEIVAITFTEKAAGELRTKIADRVATMLAEEDDAARKRTLTTIRDELSTALIGTIHAFCARVLREYPVEAGVDASFLVLEGVDQEILLREARNDAFSTIIKGDRGELRGPFLAILRQLGKSRVLRIIDALIQKRETFLRLTGPEGLYTHTDDQIFTQWHAAGISLVRSEIKRGQIVGDIRVIMEAANGAAASEVASAVAQLDVEDDPAEVSRLLHQALKKLLTSGGAISKKVIGSGRANPHSAQRIAEKWKTLRPVIESVAGMSDTNVQRRVLEWTRCLLEVVRQIMDRYEQYKLDTGYLDFDDLQLRMRDLVGHEAVRLRLTGRYKFIMVDEYQDTNMVQYEVLLPLLNGLSEGNLCIVGDPKQSIYGFRNADVAVFERTRNDILSRAGEKGDVVLGESFRPLGSIAAFVNLVFSHLMQRGDGGEFEVAYDPLVMARNNVEPGRVELILRNQAADLPGEAELIARRIRNLHGHAHQVFGKDETARAMRWGDVAVLLRSRITLEQFEEAFIRHRIPYVVAGGVGYFQTQNILDFYNYFRFLLNPKDDISLAGILRSPFYAISDATLFETAGSGRKASLWEHLSGSGHSLDGHASLARAIRMLGEDLAVGMRLSVPDLLTRIVERTGYSAVAAGIPRGEQGMANLRKLQKLARSHEQRGFSNLYDFTARLKHLIQEEEKEGQGTIDSGGDAVHIMTVHAAKGLEFPIVVVPGLERAWRTDTEPFVDDQHGIGFSVASDAPMQPPIAMILKYRSQLRTVAEEKRVFYVACTRARDMLILSGCVEAPMQSWMHWLTGSLGITVSSDATVDLRVPLRVAGDASVQPEISGEDHPLGVHLLRPDELENEMTAAGVTVQTGRVLPPIPVIEKIERQSRGEVFSASRISTYLHCPALYHLRYVVGLPEASGYRVTSGEERPDHEPKLQSTERGLILHSAMERVDSVEDAGIPDLVRDAMRVNLFPVEELSSEVDDLTRVIRRILSSSFWHGEQSATMVKTEFSVTAAIGDDYLTGTVDRFYTSPDGGITILDYKTDDIPAEQVHARASDYLTQVRIYAWLVSRFAPRSRIRGILLFTAHPEVPVVWDFDSDSILGTENECLRVIQRIKSNEYNTLASQCQSCPFRPAACPVVLPRQ